MQQSEKIFNALLKQVAWKIQTDDYKSTSNPITITYMYVPEHKMRFLT
jgi:hypothetical protein